ncbi:13524_t:CDS:1, partial [Cetraspora pellucida]
MLELLLFDKLELSISMSLLVLVASSETSMEDIGLEVRGLFK